MARIQVLRQMLVVGLKIQIEKTFGKSRTCQETTCTLAFEPLQVLAFQRDGMA